MRKIYSIVFILFFTCLTVQAKITLPNIFANNMVLQRSSKIPIWGFANPNEKVTVSFHNQIKSTIADKFGKWIIKLETELAGGPYELIIKGNNTINIKNVLVGDVWLCTGQSNMEWTVGQSLNAKMEIATANNSFIRHVKIPKTINSLPQTNIDEVVWKVCDSTTVDEFTGVGYFFAKKIYSQLKIPIGLINASWGGTNIETWISRNGFESSNEFKDMIAGMPQINLDSLSKLNVKGTEERIEKLQGAALLGTGSAVFKETFFDDSKWPQITIPGLWEQQSLGEIDGIVWLRKTIELSLADISKEAILQLAKIDDDDVTYVNGVKVGSTNQWDANRNYTIPVGVLKEGKNVIAVRVADNGGGGGIYGNTNDAKLTLATKTIELAGQWKFQVESIKKTINENSLPSLCFNTMINPLIPFAFKGVLWYQGESNAGRAYQYRTSFPLLINDWRKKWNQGSFPFYFVQLATFTTAGNSNDGCSWAELREAQTLTLQLPNTGMCVTTDIGNPSNIHPVNKQEVGKRLAAIALKNLYHKNIVCTGPTYQSIKITGNQIAVAFNNIGSGLITLDNGLDVKGFEVAGANQIFYKASAVIKNNTIIVSCKEVDKPVAVRFGWIGDASENNLFNKEGFPAVPFRTDNWKTITLNEKYKISKLK